MTSEDILHLLQTHAHPDNVAGMARFGISSRNTLGIAIPILRQLAKQIGPDHQRAQELWDSGIREARILAAYTDRAQWVTPDQMESWVADFDSWDVCDQVCENLFDRTPWAYDKAAEWAHRQEEFVRRAGFVLMASLAVHDKDASDEKFVAFFSYIREGASDERNFVKKAVNWALRQIGKRNPVLKESARTLADELAIRSDATSRWVGKDALREFNQKSRG